MFPNCLCLLVAFSLTANELSAASASSILGQSNQNPTSTAWTPSEIATGELRRNLAGEPETPQPAKPKPAVPGDGKNESNSATASPDATKAPTTLVTANIDPTKAQESPGGVDVAAVCALAKTLEDCKNVSLTVQAATQQSSMCAFQTHEMNGTKVSQCFLEDKANDSVGGSSMVIGLVFFTIAGLALYRYRNGKVVYKDHGGGGLDSVTNDLASFLGAGTGAGFNKSEAAPLARSSAADDEEWGWEDSSHGNKGHVEMSTMKHDEDLSMAFAMTSNTRQSQLPNNASPPVYSRAQGAMGTLATVGNRSQFTSSAMPITSLGVRKSSPSSSSSLTTRKKPIKKIQEDDLFTSMGLAAKPTFAASSTSKSGITVAPKVKSSTKNSSFLAATDMSVDAHWDDDGDLDDLLDD